jgi:hypothetical protein
MNSSSVCVYYNYLNIKNKINLSSKNMDENLSMFLYDKAKVYTKIICKKIYNDIENNLLTYKELRIYLLYSFLFDHKFYLNKYNLKDANLINNLFTEDQYKKDKIFIISASKNIRFNSIDQYLVCNSKGETYCYNLIMDKYISPLVWIKWRKRYEKLEQKNEESKQHKRFRNILQLIESEVGHA